MKHRKTRGNAACAPDKVKPPRGPAVPINFNRRGHHGKAYEIPEKESAVRLVISYMEDDGKSYAQSVQETAQRLGK